jgi:hypothetical protein
VSTHPGSPPPMGANAQPTVAVPKKQKKKAALSAVVGDFADLSCSDSGQPQQPKQSNCQRRSQSVSTHPVSPPCVGPQYQPTVGIPKEQKKGAAVSAPVGDFAALSCSDSGQLQQPKQSRHQGTCQSLSAHPVSPPSMAAKAQPPVGVPKKQRKGPTESSLVGDFAALPFSETEQPQPPKQRRRKRLCQSVSAHPVSLPSLEAKSQPTMGVL